MADTSEKFKNWLLRELVVAYVQARKGKRRTEDECKFELNELENLIDLRDTIVNRTYKPSRGIAFITRKPVIREIFAAPFRDRVVHHLLFNIVADWWDRRFIYDSYSCRRGKGTSMGIRRLDHHIRKVSQQYTRETYVFKMDLQGYFMSLSREELYKRVVWGLRWQLSGDENRSVYEMCEYLWYQIIFDDPTKGVKRKGRLSDWDDLPKSKSLFCQPPGQGIVIGNLTSQLLSNIYLDILDRFVTLKLGYKAYGRYVDDFFIVATEAEKKKVELDMKMIELKLVHLGLTLHPNKRYIQNIKRGVPFLGVVVYPDRLLPGKRIVRNFSEAARRFEEGRMVDRPNFGEDVGVGGLEAIISYLGYLKHVNGIMAAKKVFDGVGWEYRV